VSSLTLNSYPKNKDYYQKLIAFGKECLEICKTLNVTPVIHGSLAYLFYTKDGSIEVHDLDLLVPEAILSVLATEFTKQGIQNELSSHPSLKVLKGDEKISFHSMEYFLNNLSKTALPVDIEGSTFQILNLEALIKGYEASKNMEPKISEASSKKLEKLYLVKN